VIKYYVILFLAEALKTNMVAFIQVFSLMVWIPLSCFVWCRVSTVKSLLIVGF